MRSGMRRPARSKSIAPLWSFIAKLMFRYSDIFELAKRGKEIPRAAGDEDVPIS